MFRSKHDQEWLPFLSAGHGVQSSRKSEKGHYCGKRHSAAIIVHIVDGKCLPVQTDKPAEPAELIDILTHIVDARNCATRGGTHVGNVVYIAVMCAHRMRGSRVSNSELHNFPDDCMDSKAIARC